MSPIQADRRRPSPLLLIALAAGCLAPGCTRPVIVERAPQAYYQTAYPVLDASRRLERMLESVKAVRVTAKYRSYRFRRDAAPLESARVDRALLGRAADTADVDVSRRATVVSVGGGRGRTLFLSARHTVHLPDTMVAYFGGEDPPSSADPSSRPDSAPQRRRIRSVSFLTETASWVVGDGELHYFDVLASDERSDLAFLGVEHPESEARTRSGPPVFPAPAGEPSRLSWGSFVYVLGYPAGYPMVTRGLTSRLDRRRAADGAFTVDGVWNRGMSGGPILAVRGEDETLEWVGIARAAAVEVEHRLAPGEGAEEEQEAGVPYAGPIYLEERRRMLYGITLSVSMDEIRRFAETHRRGLRERGYRVRVP